MTRVISYRQDAITLTDEQEKNLVHLAQKLIALPPEYKGFDMKQMSCATVACACGHGPIFGLEREEDEDWDDYSHRVFGLYPLDVEEEVFWDWCFHGQWDGVDNTPQGAGRRILYMLNHGVPDDAEEQREGKAPLRY